MRSGDGRLVSTTDAASSRTPKAPVASFGEWAALVAVVAPMAWVMIASPGTFGAWRLMPWWGAVLAFVVLQAARPYVRGGSRTDIVRLGGQALLALIANAIAPMAIPGVALTAILLAIVAGGLARIPRGAALAWIALQSLALTGTYLALWPIVTALAAGFAYTAIQLTVHSAVWFAERERLRRIELEAALRELESTRALLAESVSANERSQIARDLHDVVGHHLVALGLKLDAAIAAGAVSAHVVQSRQLVRLLLADIREVVGELRNHGALDLRDALRGLATDGPGPRVIVRVDDDLPPLVGELGVTILRAAQESITNARRHADAAVVGVECGASGLRVVDDGRGGAAEIAGHGLESLAARCRAVGCGFSLASEPGRGTTITVTLPAGAHEVTEDLRQ